MIQCTSIDQFKRLKPGKRTWNNNNIEWNTELTYYIYSPYSKKYYERYSGHISLSDIKELELMINENNIYFKDETNK
jgi:hypothetical protein